MALYPVPKAVQNAASQGLARRGEHKRGGTGVSIATANALASGKSVPDAIVRRVAKHHKRHANDDTSDSTSAQGISHALMGGKSGAAWAAKLGKKIAPKPDPYLEARDQGAFSDDDVRRLIQEELDEEAGYGTGGYYWSPEPHGWVVDVFAETFVYCADGDCFQRDYTMSADGTVTLGDNVVEVIRQTTYVPEPITGDEVNDDDADDVPEEAPASESDPGDTDRRGTITIRESAGAAPVTLFETEGAITESGTSVDQGILTLRILQHGFNSSGKRYYTKEALAQAHNDKTFVGKMFLDHPTAQELKERPERSVNSVGGQITETWLDRDGHLFGKAVVVDPTFIGKLSESKRKDVLGMWGVSIHAEGVGKPGKVDGKATTIVEGFTHGYSVDFVTEPGAGGRIRALESAGAGPVTDTEEQAAMDELQKQLNELKESMGGRVTTLEASVGSLTTERDNALREAAQAKGTLRAREVADMLATSALSEASLKMLRRSIGPETTDEEIAEAIAVQKEFEAQFTPVAKPQPRRAVNLGSVGESDEARTTRTQASDATYKEAFSRFFGAKQATREFGTA